MLGLGCHVVSLAAIWFPWLPFGRGNRHLLSPVVVDAHQTHALMPNRHPSRPPAVQASTAAMLGSAMETPCATRSCDLEAELEKEMKQLRTLRASLRAKPNQGYSVFTPQ